MKLFGHPVHPLLIHFPTALLPMDLALSGIAFYKNEVAFSMAGFYCLIGGVVMGLAAILTGLLDLLQIPKDNKTAMALAIYHGFLNGVLLCVFAVIAYKAWKVYPRLELPSTGLLITKAVLVLALFAGNYMGGKLIYKHHIGIS